MNQAERNIVIAQRIFKRLNNQEIFMIGDIVKIAFKDSPTLRYFKRYSRQKIGEIMALELPPYLLNKGDSSPWHASIGVYFKRRNRSFHNLHGQCPDKHGRWFAGRDLMLLQKVEDR